MPMVDNSLFCSYGKIGSYTFNPLLSPWGGLFNLAKTMVSILHKELEYIYWKISSTRIWRSCSRGSKTNLNFQLVNKQSRISPHEVLQW